MENLQEHDAKIIEQTRKRLVALRDAKPESLCSFVASLALAHPDPLEFWGEQCEIDFINRIVTAMDDQDLNAFYEAHYDEIEEIEYKCLRSPLGRVSYDARFLAYFAVEHTAFHLRQGLPV